MNTLQSLKEFFLIPVEFFQHATRLTYCSLAIAGTIGFLWSKLIFRRPSGFDDHPTLDLTRRQEAKWLTARIWVLLALCVASYLLAYHQLPDWFPTFFQGVPK